MNREMLPSTRGAIEPGERVLAPLLVDGPLHGSERPALRRDRPIRACMLAYTFYETDARVMRYAQALRDEGAIVDAIVLGRHGAPSREMVGDVRVIRVQRRAKNERSRRSFLARLLAFWIRSFYRLSRNHLADPYDVVHVHSVPDFEVFAALLPKLTGAKIILDIHDIVPEFYAAKFKAEPDDLVIRALRLVERLSARFADHVIIANDLWLKTISERSVPAAKCTSMINYPDTKVFGPALRTREDGGPFRMIYPGTLNRHQGLDIAIDAFAIVSKTLDDVEMHIYGEGETTTELRQQIERLGLDDKVSIFPPLPLSQIAVVMANADVGVVPKRNDAFGGDAFSTKILELMALGVPVIVANTRIDTRYFDETLVRFFEAGDAASLAAAMMDAYLDRERSGRLVERAFEYVSHNSWQVKRREYLSLVDRLIDERR